MKSFILFTDGEGPLVLTDLARAAAARMQLEHNGHAVDGRFLFDTISLYNAYKAETTGPNQPGDTLALLIPHLVTHKIGDDDLQAEAAKTQLAPGVKEFLDLVRRDWEIYVVSSAYNHLWNYVKHKADLGLTYREVISSGVKLGRIWLSQEAKDKIHQAEQQVLDRETGILKETEAFKNGTSVQEIFDTGTSLGEVCEIFDRLYISDLPRLGFVPSHACDVMNGKRKAEFVYQKALERGVDISRVAYIGDSITDDQALKLVREHQGLAIALNGDEFAIRNANVAVALEDRRNLKPILDAWANSGMEGINHFVEGQSSQAVDKERNFGQEGQGITCQFVTPENVGEIARVHSAYRGKSCEGAVPLI